MNALRSSFLAGIHSVQPQNLIPKWISREGEALRIGERTYALKDTYVVGFGKAVGGMVPCLENVFKTSSGSYIKEGIISVPHGYLDCLGTSNVGTGTSHPLIKFYEGAKFNLPDLAAQNTAERIKKLVDGLQEDSLLLVLISGGGSALLPLPLPPLNLEEKSQIIKSLSLAGASITDINTIRRAISSIKGGKLIEKTKAQVVSFILSDIIGNSFALIASGPTVPSDAFLEEPIRILQRYNVPITDNLKCALETKGLDKRPSEVDVYNVLVGDNSTALSSINSYIKTNQDLNCIPFCLSTSLKGDAASVGREIANLSFSLLQILSNKNCKISLKSIWEKLQIPPHNIEVLESTLYGNEEEDGVSSICLLFGGETTVEVKGTGTGGRNQEMILAASLEMEKLSTMHDVNGELVILSGGTDGIDGPTDAAGAITFYSKTKEGIRLQTSEARRQGLQPEHFLGDNNSNEYFSRLSSGAYLLKPGHTGTNVMDVQLVYIALR